MALERRKGLNKTYVCICWLLWQLIRAVFLRGAAPRFAKTWCICCSYVCLCADNILRTLRKCSICDIKLNYMFEWLKRWISFSCIFKGLMTRIWFLWWSIVVMLPTKKCQATNVGKRVVRNATFYEKLLNFSRHF